MGGDYYLNEPTLDLMGDDTYRLIVDCNPRGKEHKSFKNLETAEKVYFKEKEKFDRQYQKDRVIKRLYG